MLMKFTILVLISTIGAKHFLVETEGLSSSVGEKKSQEKGTDYSDSSKPQSGALSVVEILCSNCLGSNHDSKLPPIRAQYLANESAPLFIRREEEE